jgi:hypothetical protein
MPKLRPCMDMVTIAPIISNPEDANAIKRLPIKSIFVLSGTRVKVFMSTLDQMFKVDGFFL